MPKEPRDDDRVFHLGGAYGGRGEPPVDGPQPNLRPVISPSSVGATLSITREKFGQELRQVAQTLRIKQAYLEAIEDDRYADLPGLTYAVGFVRSYADYLGLDSKLLVERYKQEAQGLNRKSQLVFPTPASEAKVPTGAIILMALILIGFTYIGWTYFSDEAQQPPAVAGAPAEPKATVPVAPAPAPAATAGGNASGTTVTGAAPAPAPAAALPTPAPAATADSDTAVAGVAAAETATAPAQPDATAAVASEAPAPALGAAAAADSVSPVPAAPPAPTAAAATETATATTQTAMAPPLPPAVELAHQPRLVIRAAQDSWVQIRNAKDEAVLTKVLREGESYEVPEELGLVLLTGNAGGLTLVLDGKPLPSLGPVGAVRRNIALDPELLAAP